MVVAMYYSYSEWCVPHQAAEHPLENKGVPNSGVSIDYVVWKNLSKRANKTIKNIQSHIRTVTVIAKS